MNFSSLFKTDFFLFFQVYQLNWKNEQNNNKKTELLMMFSYVCDATVCIFVPVLEVKGVTSVFRLHSDKLFCFQTAKAWLCFKHTDDSNH